MKSLLLAVAIVCTVQIYAQQPEGKVSIAGDTRATQLVEKHIELNRLTTTTHGFRIQVASLSGNDSRGRAIALQNQINEIYPEIGVYVTFDEPCFKVKIGDFKTRLQAYAFLNQIKDIYPGAIVKDLVYIRPVIDPNTEFSNSEF
ncbi:MAG: SPOR domain-containing protein [Bacteroidales bacterium]|nr:SPOR domain-containing protein [Candidatus Colimorpha onthohippi]